MIMRLVSVSLAALLIVSLLWPDILNGPAMNLATAAKWYFLASFTLTAIALSTPLSDDHVAEIRKACGKATYPVWRNIALVLDVCLILAFAAAGRYGWATCFLVLIAFNRAVFHSRKREIGVAV